MKECAYCQQKKAGKFYNTQHGPACESCYKYLKREGRA